jgi:1,4-alpha-glucan branching enzyme
MMMTIKKRTTKKVTKKRVTVKKKKTKKVNFTMVAPEAQNIFLAGNFNGWDINSHPLKKGAKGIWKASMSLMPGVYEYRFLVNGEWQNDPNCTSFVPNSYGSENCVITLEDE